MAKCQPTHHPVNQNDKKDENDIKYNNYKQLAVNTFDVLISTCFDDNLFKELRSENDAQNEMMKILMNDMTVNNNKLENLYRSDDEGLTWVTLAKPKNYEYRTPADDFTRGQAWYDQAIAVDPNNPNTVIVGGIDLFKSTEFCPDNVLE